MGTLLLLTLAKESNMDTYLHRYTGVLPPIDVIQSFTTWEFCLDEEGVEGQDESTIRPQDTSGILTCETNACSVRIQLANGLVTYGLIWMSDYNIESMRFHMNQSYAWLVKEFECPQWTTSERKWGTALGGISLDLREDTVFPMKVTLLCANAAELDTHWFFIGIDGHIGDLG